MSKKCDICHRKLLLEENLKTLHEDTLESAKKLLILDEHCRMLRTSLRFAQQKTTANPSYFRPCPFDQLDGLKLPDRLTSIALCPVHHSETFPALITFEAILERNKAALITLKDEANQSLSFEEKEVLSVMHSTAEQAIQNQELFLKTFKALRDRFYLNALELRYSNTPFDLFKRAREGAIPKAPSLQRPQIKPIITWAWVSHLKRLFLAE